MSGVELDEIDRIILHALQENARDNTNSAISERVSVSASTVSKRISRLEDAGIIKSYRPEIDYELAGFPLHVLFICTVTIAQREELIQETLDVEGVLDVRELMTGEGNVHVRVTGTSNDDITRIAQKLDRMGYRVNDETLIRDEYHRLSDHFQNVPPVGHSESFAE